MEKQDEKPLSEAALALLNSVPEIATGLKGVAPTRKNIWAALHDEFRPERWKNYKLYLDIQDYEQPPSAISLLADETRFANDTFFKEAERWQGKDAFKILGSPKDRAQDIKKSSVR